MNLSDHERYGKIRLFETFIRALSALVDEDDALFSWKKRRIAITHRLALHLDHGFAEAFPATKESPLAVDMGAPVSDDSRIMIPDILVHNRTQSSPRPLMAVVCREGYLTEQELIELHELREESACELTLAISFLVARDYMLIYRFDETTIDYYHFLRHEKHCQLFRRRELGDLPSDAHQLKLAIRTRKVSARRR
jgi:hypothetical protein